MTYKYQTLIFDLETDGLLHELTRVHIMVIREFETGRSWVFRRNRHEDNILEGIKMLNEAETLVMHNGVGFDCPALWKVYGEDFSPKGKMRDTLVMCRMYFADQKERDFRLHRRGLLDGKNIGTHTLEAWGQRLGYPKDDYSKRRAAELKEQFPDLPKEEINRLVWATWNQDMEDYAIVDGEVTEALWDKIVKIPWSEEAIILEHRVHELMERATRNGFPFDMEGARRMEEDLRTNFDEKTARAKEHFGSWWVPKKWYEGKPRPELGEENSNRHHWGEVVVPTRSVNYKDPAKGDRIEGAAFCPVVMKDFNPNSRPMIIDRLMKIYEWEPQDFTETITKRWPKGTPKVDDEILRDIGKTVPIAIDLAEIFYYKKRLGQLVDGDNGWIQKAQLFNDGYIHPRFIVGGAVTNRATHSNPNIAQVPRVVFKKLKQWQEKGVTYRLEKGELVYGIERPDGSFDMNLTPLLDPDGKQFVGTPKIAKKGDIILNKVGETITAEGGEYVYDKEGKIETKKSLMKGRAGDHGWECRSLFIVPDGWKLMGADQKGIELRCLGHYMAEYDGGKYGRLCVESDPHDLHQQVMELDSRDTAKTFIYAMIYGAGPFKLGITLEPALAVRPAAAKNLGIEMNRRIMTRIPALGSVVKAVQKEARRGYLDALDGRRLFVRSPHAALNTKLQGAAATISKMWCVLFEEYMEDAGLVHGWEGDFAVLAWVHDELQVAVRDDQRIMDIAKECIERAGRNAGKLLNFSMPVDVDVKFGRNWAETH